MAATVEADAAELGGGVHRLVRIRLDQTGGCEHGQAADGLLLIEEDAMPSVLGLMERREARAWQ
ncbi:hypothetical protein ACIBBE_48985, partial [Streptomyces sp. NPDC051644]|uniref:hypothetical protein n=1 Tax=Streptomyces sp. NPDC051644 TaxID=3365666 RepID=UPI0037A52038